MVELEEHVGWCLKIRGGITKEKVRMCLNTRAKTSIKQVCYYARREKIAFLATLSFLLWVLLINAGPQNVSKRSQF